MGKLRFMRAIGLIIVVLYGCTSPSQTPTPNKMIQASLLVSQNTPTYISREGWTEYQQVGFGSLIYPTDLIKTDSQLSILCPDIQTVMPFTGSGRNPCPLPTADQGLIYDEMSFASGSRGNASTQIPYILYPRSTAILETHPILSWHDSGASTYTVEIREGANLIWQQKNVGEPTIEYPANAPDLKPGKDYLLVITDDDTGQVSSADPNKGLGFQLVSKTQAATIKKQADSILSLSTLDPIAQKLVLALYDEQLDINGRGLWGEASKLYEEITNVAPQAPAVHLRSGDVFIKMKLWNEAEAEYKIAFAQAETINDLETQANASYSLWHILSEQMYFDQAIMLYEKLGAQDKVDKLKAEIRP